MVKGLHAGFPAVNRRVHRRDAADGRREEVAGVAMDTPIVATVRSIRYGLDGVQLINDW